MCVYLCQDAYILHAVYRLCGYTALVSRAGFQNLLNMEVLSRERHSLCTSVHTSHRLKASLTRAIWSTHS